MQILDYKIDLTLFSVRLSSIKMRLMQYHFFNITCSMRLSARRANDSRRPGLTMGIVGGNGGVDMSNVLQMYIRCGTANLIALF